MANVELTANFDSFDTFKLFKKELRTQLIENGLDSSLIISTNKLVENLKFVVNEKITMNGTEPSTANSEKTENDLGQPKVNIPKSEEELVKFLTNGKANPANYNKSKDYTSLNETNMVFGQNSKNGANTNRVTLRMEISPEETVESQHLKAVEFFKTAVFGLPDSGGKMGYYVNPGIDLSQYVKIKCSVFTGAGNGKTKKGFNPTERFEKNKGRGYAEWTIKQDAVELVRKSYINITDVMNLLKNGDIDRAKSFLDRLDKNQALAIVKSQVDLLQTGKGLPVGTQSYTNAIKLINNLKITKKITEEDTTYSLVSSFEDFDTKEVDFYEYIQKEIRAWVVDNEDFWFNSLVVIAEQLIKQYGS